MKLANGSWLLAGWQSAHAGTCTAGTPPSHFTQSGRRERTSKAGSRLGNIHRCQCSWPVRRGTVGTLHKFLSFRKYGDEKQRANGSQMLVMRRYTGRRMPLRQEAWSFCQHGVADPLPRVLKPRIFSPVIALPPHSSSPWAGYGVSVSDVPTTAPAS